MQNAAKNICPVARVRRDSLLSGILAALAASFTGCTVMINHIPTSGVNATGSAVSAFRLSVPAQSQSVSAYQKFSGNCDPSVPLISITYPASTWGPATTSCASDGTFSVGINVIASSNPVRSLVLTQAGVGSITRDVVYQPGGMSGVPTGFSAQVNAIAYDAAGDKTYIGGNFYSVGGVPVAALARLNSDGTLDTSFVPPGGGFDYAVSALYWDATASKLYVGGDFTSYKNSSGTTTVRRLVRMNTDGSIDTGYIPAGKGFNTTVTAITMDASGRLYVGGTFNNYTNGAGNTQARLTRLNTDGTVDSTYVSATGGFNNAVNALALDPATGKLYVGGDFTSYTKGAATTQNYLARLNSDGSLDTTFIPAGEGMNSSVYALAYDSASTNLYVGGNFTTHTRSATTTTQNYLTRLTSGGVADTTFLLNGQGFNGKVWSLSLDAAGSRLYVGGSYSSFTKGAATTQLSISRLNTGTGAVDTAFIPAGGGNDGSTYALACLAGNSKVLVGGDFITFYSGSGYRQSCLSRLSATNGAVDTGYMPMGGGPNDYIWSMAFDPSARKLYMGGDFTSYTINGTAISQRRLSRFNQDGTVDSFVPQGTTKGFSSTVSAITFDSSGRVYAGGAFTTYTDTVTSTQNRLTRLNADGTADTTYVSTTGGFNGNVSSLALDASTGKLYVGGAFTSYNKGGATVQNYIARLNSDGTLDTSFIPAGAGFNGAVSALVYDAVAGKLYVGGAFTSFTNGSTVTQNRISRLNSNGTVDVSFVPDLAGFNGNVSALALDSTTGKLVAGGAFTSFTNGTTTTQNRISRLTASGAVDTGWVPAGGGFDAAVNALLVDTSGNVVAGGVFTQYTNGSAVGQLGVSRIKGDGTVDTTFVPAGGGFNNLVNSLALDPTTGAVYVGGTMTSYMGVVVSRMAKLNSDGSLSP